MELPAAFELVAIGRHQRTQIFQQPSQRARLVTQVARVHQGEGQGRLLQSPEHGAGDLGQALIVDQVVEQRGDHIHHGELRRRNTHLAQARPRVGEEALAGLPAVRRHADGMRESQRIALELDHRLQRGQRRQRQRSGGGQRR